MALTTDTETPDLLDRLWGEIQDLHLEPYVAELDALGYTIVPPELAAPPGFASRLLEACLDVAEDRNGERPDLDTGKTHENFQGHFAAFSGPDGDSPIGDLMQCMLYEDQVFEEALMNRVLLALVTHLCGYRCVLSSMGCFMKGPNKSPFQLHCDVDLPAPLPPYAMVCNATWLLTDMNRENGSTAMVPGSHRWARRPVGPSAGGTDETDPTKNPKAIAIEAPAGSLLVWHGNTWHGAFNRTAPGLRVQIPVYIARHNMRSQENMTERITDEMLERNEPRFAQLTQQGVTYGYTTHRDGIARAQRARARTGAYMASLGTATLGSDNQLSS